MKTYDYLIVGSGLFGSIFAREMTNNGASCLVIDKRGHIRGSGQKATYEEAKIVGEV